MMLENVTIDVQNVKRENVKNSGICIYKEIKIVFA